jgi:hypothetical protein
MITAEQIFESREFQQVFQEIDSDLIGRLRSTPPVESGVLQEVAMKLWALDQVKAEFERRMSKGGETRINQRKA